MELNWPQETNSFVSLVKLCVPDSIIFNTLRILKRLVPGDTYLENYRWHQKKQGEKFFDFYHLAWWYGTFRQPKRILEIGTRTGISLCQILSSLENYEDMTVVSCDTFSDGFISPALVSRNLRALNIPAEIVHYMVGDSAVTIPKYKEDHPDERFDWILVDGDHERKAARRDLDNVVDLVAFGGLLVMDDLSKDGMDLLPVWEDFRNDHSEQFQFHTNLDGKGTGWAWRLQ